MDDAEWIRRQRPRTVSAWSTEAKCLDAAAMGVMALEVAERIVAGDREDALLELKQTRLRMKHLIASLEI